MTVSAVIAGFVGISALLLGTTAASAQSAAASAQSADASPTIKITLEGQGECSSRMLLRGRPAHFTPSCELDIYAPTTPSEPFYYQVRISGARPQTLDFHVIPGNFRPGDVHQVPIQIDDFPGIGDEIREANRILPPMSKQARLSSREVAYAWRVAFYAKAALEQIQIRSHLVLERYEKGLESLHTLACRTLLTTTPTVALAGPSMRARLLYVCPRQVVSDEDIRRAEEENARSLMVAIDQDLATETNVPANDLRRYQAAIGYYMALDASQELRLMDEVRAGFVAAEARILARFNPNAVQTPPFVAPVAPEANQPSATPPPAPAHDPHPNVPQ